MTVFENAKLAETREKFIGRRKSQMKYRKEELEAMKAYIMSDQCVKDLERLESGDYFLDYPQYRLVAKNFNDKKRAVYSFRGNESFLLKLLMYAMKPYESKYSDRLYSFRSDRVGKDLLNELHERNSEITRCYVLKTDVSNYVGSIVPELIIPMIEELMLPQDKAFCDFLEWLLKRRKVININGELIDHDPGGLGGVALSNFFMNLYLHEMDDYYASRAVFYSRYSDDILICARTFDEVKEYEKFFYETLERLQLKTNREKTQIINPGEPFDILGMNFEGDKVSISEHSMKKIKRKIRRFTKIALKSISYGRSREDAARTLIARHNRFFFGLEDGSKQLSWARWAFPVLNDMGSLQEIDHYFQDSLRYVLYGSITKKRRYKVPYDKFSELGYRSLVFYYHHQEKIKEAPRYAFPNPKD